MKKYCLIFIFVITIILSACSNGANNSWKDTEQIYGDGTYQMFHHTERGRAVSGIINKKYNQCVLNEVLSYYEYDNKLYFMGIFNEYEIYAIINLQNNIVKYYPKIDSNNDILGMIHMDDMIKAGDLILINQFTEFTEDEQNILNQLCNK